MVEINLERRPKSAEQAACSAELVRRACSGEVAAFEALYRRNEGRVYAICLRMVADPVRAATLTQDTFVRAWQRLSSFRGESTFSSWLHRIAVNIVLMDLRTARRHSARIQTTDNLEQLDHATPPANPATALDLEAGIAALPPQARAVLVLHAIEGYRHEEIGEMLGIAPGTSKAHLHRARRLLSERLTRKT